MRRPSTRSRRPPGKSISNRLSATCTPWTSTSGKGTDATFPLRLVRARQPRHRRPCQTVEPPLERPAQHVVPRGELLLPFSRFCRFELLDQWRPEFATPANLLRHAQSLPEVTLRLPVDTTLHAQARILAEPDRARPWTDPTTRPDARVLAFGRSSTAGDLLLHPLAQPARPSVPLVLPTEILLSQT